MIVLEYENFEFKIYASGKIKSNAPDDLKEFIKNFIEAISFKYNDPSDGFFISYIADKIKKLPSAMGIKLVRYRDYEKENADPNTIY